MASSRLRSTANAPAPATVPQRRMEKAHEPCCKVWSGPGRADQDLSSGSPNGPSHASMAALTLSGIRVVDATS
jgi:hypothetical protein